MKTKQAKWTGYIINKCKHCGCDGQHPCATPNGNCYWTDRDCSVCSCCAVGRGIKIRKDCYRIDQKKCSARGRLADARREKPCTTPT